MTFTELQTDIANRLNIVNTDGLTRIGTAINRHYRRITAALGIAPVVRRTTITAAATISSRYITVSGVEKVERVRDTSSGSTRVLDQVLVDDLMEIDGNTSDEPSKFAIYSMSTDSVVILTDCVAQTAYELQVDGLAALSTLSGSQEPAFPESFHDVLIEAVLADELRKKGKMSEAEASREEARRILSDLRMHIAKSGYLQLTQGERASSTGIGSGGGGGSTSGGTSYTQTGLITFDRDPSAPFAVSDTSAYVPNLFVEGVGNVTTDRLLGRDTAGAGESEQLTVGGGVEFTGSGGIQRSALTGDITAPAGSGATTIPSDTVTYAKMQNVSATSRVLGRKTAAAGDTEECTLSEVLDFIGSAAQGDIFYRGAATWARLAAGTSGYFLKTLGAGSNPAWAAATSKPFAVFTASSNQPPSAAYATPDTRNSRPVLDFDGATDEEAVFASVLPVSYASGGLTIELWVSFTTATSGNAHWQAAIERIDVSSLDTDADSFVAFNESDVVAAPGTSGQVIKFMVTFTDGADMDSLAAGEAYRLKIRRDADGSGGTDDITTDAELQFVVVRET